jgi:hypothetical protein
MSFAKIDKKVYGEAPATGPRNVSQVPSTKAALPPIETDRWFRNGLHPDAEAMNLVNEGVNKSLLYRTKESFSFTYFLGSSVGHVLGSTAGTRAVWRAAFHLSPYSHALLVRVLMHPPTSNFTYDTYSKLEIFSDASESSLVTTVEFHYGANPLQDAGVVGWQYLKVIDKFVDGLTANTTYYARISDVDYGCINSICAADLQSMSENLDGYLPVNFTEETQILDKYRENLVTPIPSMWKRGAAKILNWSSEWPTPPESTSATPTNILDGASTTYGSSIPGYTLDMTGKARLSQSTGVPFRMSVFAKSSTDGKGRVYLKDSGGATVCSITDSWNTGSGAWQTTTGVLPANSAKYYLMFDDNSSTGTFSLYAVSLYEYEA